MKKNMLVKEMIVWLQVHKECEDFDSGCLTLLQNFNFRVKITVLKEFYALSFDLHVKKMANAKTRKRKDPKCLERVLCSVFRLTCKTKKANTNTRKRKDPKCKTNPSRKSDPEAVGVHLVVCGLQKM